MTDKEYLFFRVRITTTRPVWGVVPHASCGMDSNQPARPPPRVQRHDLHVRCVATPPGRAGQRTQQPARSSRPGLFSHLPNPGCRHPLPPSEPLPSSSDFSGCHGNQSRSVGQTHRKPHPNPPHPSPPLQPALQRRSTKIR